MPSIFLNGQLITSKIVLYYRQPIINQGLSEFRSVVFYDEILVQTLTASQTKTMCVLTN